MTHSKPKEPPNSKEAEMMVLGCMLTSHPAFSVAINGLATDDFYFAEHKLIFDALHVLYSQDRPSDIHLVGEELKRQEKLKSVGGIGYLTTLAQYAGTAAYIEEYVDLVKNKTLSRRLLALGESIQKKALENPDDPFLILDACREELDKLSANNASQLPIPFMEDRLLELEEKLKTLRGKKHLGLCQKTIQEIDDKLLGLRKLIVLAAAPNVGKTAITNQFVIDILKNHPESCVVYFSLEMTVEDLLIRTLCNQTQMDYKTFVLGSDQSGGMIRDAFFSEMELTAINKAQIFLKSLRNRLQIVDKEMCPFLTASHAIAYINTVKQRTGCERVFVVIDYLQVWPLNPQVRFFNENEIDKWRMGEAMKIRDAINGDPIIVISEARKPQGDGKWGGDLSDVMGAARMTYSPDAVLLFSQLDFD